MKQKLLTMTILLLIQTLNAQCLDVTEQVEFILSKQEVTTYDLRVIGSCIDESKNLHITIVLDPENLRALLNFGFSTERVAVIQTLEPFFTSVRKLFDEFQSVLFIRFYYVEFEEVRDAYGYPIRAKKNILNSLGIQRGTVGRINWHYIDKNLKDIMGFGEYPELYKMLDEVYIKGKRLK